MERGTRPGQLPSSWPNLLPSWKLPWEGDKEGSLSDSSQLPHQSQLGAGPAWGGRRRSGGEGAAALFPELAFSGGAGEHTVPIRSSVLCCMCFHGFFCREEWGEEVPVSPAAGRA